VNPEILEETSRNASMIKDIPSLLASKIVWITQLCWPVENISRSWCKSRIT